MIARAVSPPRDSLASWNASRGLLRAERHGGLLRRRRGYVASPTGGRSWACWHPEGVASSTLRVDFLNRVAPPFVAVLMMLALSACDSSATRPGASSAAHGSRSASLDAPGTLSPIRAAAPIRLRDSLGRTVDLRNYAGKAVFVTFIYTHCPDVCPLIVGNLHAALTQLGPGAAKVQLIAVSTDPVGDTPRTVKPFLREHELTGRIEYLLGSASQLRRVWKAWGIEARRVGSSPEAVDHSASIYGISATGKLTALYPSMFKPEWIAHDAPLLAGR